jgi:hypothetical protein
MLGGDTLGVHHVYHGASVTCVNADLP